MLSAALFAQAGEIEIPAGTTSIPEGAFRGREDVTSVRVPRSVTSVGAFAFADCSRLESVVFEEGTRLREIGAYAFWDCMELRELRLPPVASFGEACFQGCSSLKELVVPAGVAELPRYFAAWCTSLEKVSLPRSLRKIGAHAFIYCGSLAEVSLPRGLERIGNNAFTRCSGLREVSVPASVTLVDSYAFSDCVSLVRAALPANASMLGELIFSGCASLELLEEPSRTPPPLDCNSFLFEPDEEAIYQRCRLLVPEGSAPAYAKAPAWRLFRHIETSR